MSSVNLGSVSSVDFEDGKVKFSVDSDKDGTPSASISVVLSEAVSEALNKGESQSLTGAFNIRLDGLKIVFSSDFDRNEEVSMEGFINLPEAYDEASKVIK